MKVRFLSFRQRVLSAYRWEKLSPFSWTSNEIKFFLASFLALMLPVYIFIGLQPAPIADAASYPQLEINSIDLKTPVASIELTDRQLIAPATIAGVYLNAPNKTFIIGHSSTVFTKLDRVKVGDALTYDNREYIVQKIQTLTKADIDMRKILQAEEQETMIIMTCAGEPLPNQDATHRLIITAYLTE